jgi:Cd2+/Zn2+-exporting ATPase
VDKAAGDTLFASTINDTGTLEMRVTATASNTTLSRIIHAVEQAQGSRAPPQQFVDKFAAIYTPVVFALAVEVAVLMPWLVDVAWTQALYKALVLLVIACPCALVIATPVTVVSGLAAAARRGILIKGGVYLETAHQIKAIALDKTGTITEGRPRLVATEVLPSPEGNAPVASAQVLRWAGDLAGHSDHPVSRAIAQGLAAAQGAAPGAAPGGALEAFTALPGRGVQARVAGQRLVLGNHRLMEELGLCNPGIEARLAAHEAQGRTVTLLATDAAVLALFAVADTIKDSSREALAALHALGVLPVMLTGDNTVTARTVAAQAGLNEVQGNLLPQDKLAAIEALQARHGLTAMVGDGINDAPALARADIGIAMGAAGTDTAMEAADVVIMNDDLRRIPQLIRLSRQTRTVLWQNIALALGIKVVFLFLALFNGASMWMAVFADMGASLIVVFNGLRMLRAVDEAPAK